MSKDQQKPPDVSFRGAGSALKPVRQTFPGPRGAHALLRVAFDREPHANLIAHAKSSLNAEVCGVLAGLVCEDDEGLFIHVLAAVPGVAATEGNTHVTFTQETWTHIHAEMDRKHPKLRIVGWYHTHPGFGVEFSEMDLFIQRNFFNGNAQIALVTDPLSGASAVITSLPEKGITYLPHYWVDGRQQTSAVPKDQDYNGENAISTTSRQIASSAALQTLETRVDQLTQTLEATRNDFYKMLLFCGLMICIGVIVSAGFFIRSMFLARNEPPHLNGFIPLPLQVGDKKIMLGLDVVSWSVPPELDAMLLQELKDKEEAARQAAGEQHTPAPPQEPAQDAPSGGVNPVSPPPSPAPASTSSAPSAGS